VIRYEELAANPRPVLKALGNWLDVDPKGFKSQMIRAGSVGKYRSGLSEPRHVVVVSALATTCFRADVLRRLGWGEGLTEDYAFRQRLLLECIKIRYEPAAVGYGEAPLTWQAARAQRARWLRGTHDASRQFARRLLVEGLKRRDLALLDGALQAYLPSYSTLTMLSGVFLLVHLLINWQPGPVFAWYLIGAWVALVGALFVYPLIGLALEHAPPKAYLAILAGPLFIVWRTWLALTARFGRRPVVWIRTAHGGGKGDKERGSGGAEEIG
jgi:cellulose synthase/poly-beta-1,6-N-acetylglucosamine synthase-like glycosyltransferase